MSAEIDADRMGTTEGPTAPGMFDTSLAASLGLTKREVLAATEAPDRKSITQFGGGYLDTSLTLPEPPADRSIDEPLIDMFVCGADGSCQAAGSDKALVALWEPAVRAMTDAVFSTLKRFAVPVAPEAYVTASFTPGSEVVGQAHVDDDQYFPDAGIGIVAIVGSDIGPRVATAPIAVPEPRPGLPLAIEQGTFDRFTEGELPYQQAEPGRILMFGQFGQLHAGPALASTEPGVTRRLLVFRAETVPAGSL